MTKRPISLIIPTNGNPIALKTTLESFKGVVDEFVIGSVCIFPDDEALIESYQDEYNLRVIKLPFNYIFSMGFSSVLNFLMENAKNDICLYSNTGEVIHTNYGINKIIDNNPECNCFYFTHPVEKHRWFRCFDKKEIQWSGRLHEEPRGAERPYHKPIYCMSDTEKDMGDTFKAAVLNSVKEMCYWYQLIKIVDNPKLKEATNDHWVNFAKEQYQSMKDRLEQKGKQYEAFQIGDFNMFWNDINESNYFNETKFESVEGLNFQGARKDIL